MFEIQDWHNKKYISLETYRKNGIPVRTPVWFVILDNTIHVVTREDTGKIKRLRNNKSVKIALCTFNGKSTGEWISGTGQFVTNDIFEKVIELRKQKYGFMERVARFVSRKRGKLVVFSIETK
ncbi:MAG: PPOX class F420-dependent oxidoreductase [Nitrosopumilus sp.]|nr:PPOX class F420-dependent oxidoreductase [Nitrosopumilus sp.]MDH3490162.1 PPOX class F420-dependent oxidoreductase [Nitrosopumilus sp.]MDH3516901.1 PPOX class F420-dependent oxidoreductase [Nitrosopumilus sp.]MDH3565276.1 PPOX class F420-dependent oxidoreductase [Nitrosopumilus sp.]MDH5416668.1 PPOX class F420-dependent oxidoreductase [Nitrosopumilus sp.]